MAHRSRRGRCISRTDPASRGSSRSYCSLDPGGFFYLEPMAVLTQASANALISTTTTTTSPPNRRNSSTDLAWSRSRGYRASSTSTTADQHINAINGDRVIDFAFRSLEAYFGIQIPPIFNVCPHSVHRIFPRIDIDDALARLADDRARPAPERRAKRAMSGAIPERST